MMKKTIVLLFVAMVITAFAFAAQFHSIPLGHEAYRIIEVAEIRGAIPVQTEVKPYSLNVVRALFDKILSSDAFSESEKSQVRRVLSDLDSLYGNEPTVEFADLFRRGYLRTSGVNTTTVGGSIALDMTVGHDTEGNSILDARGNGTAYISGDLLGFISYDLNFRLSLDRIDTRSRMITDLQINCDGFYEDFFGTSTGDQRLRKLPDSSGRFWLGIEAFPEVSLGTQDGTIGVRFGTIRRDWGPGLNNIGLSGSARAFDGLEISLRPVSWFSYNVLTGSLGNVSLDSVNGVEWPSENMDTRGGKYYNNISIHRVELGPFSGLKAGIWESVVWRKRFEIDYLNPLSIYMFAQNALGDYDNVLAGLDLTYTLPGVGQFYAVLSMDELNNFHFLKNPRDILAYQLGARFAPRFFGFSELTVQTTYVPAFYGSHYESKEKLFADVPYTTAYVNKGQNLGYPVNPDTLEFLLDFKTSFATGWTLDITVKDQMRSAQYASKTTGTDILTFMSYKGYDAGNYKDRDFFGNIWDNLLDVELKVERKLDDFPLSFSCGIIGIWEHTRSFVPTVLHDAGGALYNGFDYNPGSIVSWGEWTDILTFNATFGMRLYY